MKNLRHHGIRNLTASHWHLPLAAFLAKIAPRGVTSQKTGY
jgi:hypothetical protein